MLENLASLIGEMMEVENELAGIGNFLKVRVRIDVHETLTKYVTVTRNKKREKIAWLTRKFQCSDHMECGIREHLEKYLKWGSHLKAGRDTWNGRCVFGRERGTNTGGRSMDREDASHSRGRGGEYYD